MRTQEQRDEQTLAITSALGLFIAILVAVGVVLWLLDSVLGVSGTPVDAIFEVAVGVAAALAVVHLVRATRS